MSAYPAVPRAFAAAAAVGIALWFGAAQAAGFVGTGCVAAASVAGAVSGVTALFLALLAIAPATLEGPMRRFTRVDLRDGGDVGALVVVTCALFFVLGWGALVSAAAVVEAAIGSCGVPVQIPTGGTEILVGVALSFALFTLPVLLYVSFVHDAGPIAALDKLGLRARGGPRAFGIGVIAALLFLLALVVASAVAEQFLPQDAMRNDAALDIARSVTPLGALALAIGSGVGEEIFFRGFLQPRVGVWASSLLFALAHFSYGSVAEVVVVLALSLALGLLYKRTGNLLAPIAAHFAFNLIMLLAAGFVPEPA